MTEGSFSHSVFHPFTCDGEKKITVGSRTVLKKSRNVLPTDNEQLHNYKKTLNENTNLHELPVSHKVARAGAEVSVSQVAILIQKYGDTTDIRRRIVMK